MREKKAKKKETEPHSTVEVPWTFKPFSKPVDRDFQALDTRCQAELLVAFERVKEVGLNFAGSDLVSHIWGKIWEIRAYEAQSKHWIRALYRVLTGRIIEVLRIFAKKTNKTPQTEIEVAKQRMRHSGG